MRLLFHKSLNQYILISIPVKNDKRGCFYLYKFLFVVGIKKLGKHEKRYYCFISSNFFKCTHFQKTKRMSYLVHVIYYIKCEIRLLILSILPIKSFNQKNTFNKPQKL